MLILLVPRPLIFVVVLFRFFFSVHLLLMVLQGGGGVGVDIKRDLFQLMKGFNSQL